MSARRSTLRTPDQLRARCGRCPGAVEEFPFGPGVAVWKVQGRVFAIVSVEGEPAEISLKCDPDEAVALREQYPSVTPGYHLNKRHWNTVVTEGSIPDDEVDEMIAESHRLVVAGLPRRLRPEPGDP